MTIPNGVKILGAVRPQHSEILSPEALSFFAALQRQFNVRRLELLAKRRERQTALDRGENPGFLKDTEHIRSGSWNVEPVPPDLQNRRVEITGPVDRKMV